MNDNYVEKWNRWLTIRKCIAIAFILAVLGLSVVLSVVIKAEWQIKRERAVYEFESQFREGPLGWGSSR